MKSRLPKVLLFSSTSKTFFPKLSLYKIFGAFIAGLFGATVICNLAPHSSQKTESLGLTWLHSGHLTPFFILTQLQPPSLCLPLPNSSFQVLYFVHQHQPRIGATKIKKHDGGEN
jgi:hypothetical protein